MRSYNEDQLREAKKELGITDRDIAKWAGYPNANTYNASSRKSTGENKLSVKERIEGVIIGMHQRFKEMVAKKLNI